MCIMLDFTIRGYNFMVHLQFTAPELEQASQFYGIYSRIARKLGVTPQHVSQVSKGLHRSKRVTAAIEKEMRRIRGKMQERAA